MRLKEYEIVIEPREILFEHIIPGKLFTKTLNIKNVGTKSKRMELFRPSNKAFKLHVKNPVLPVPSGMEIAAIVEFQTDESIEYMDKLVVSIDNREVEIPIRAFPAKPILEADSVINFGIQGANYKTVSSYFQIKNSGAVDGDFAFSYKGDYTVTFTPQQGSVFAFSNTTIKVDFFTKGASVVDEKINLTLQGQDKPHVVHLKANIMDHFLELLRPGTEDKVERIDFGCCYYGCDLTSFSILYNNSPDKLNYVIVLEEKGVGAEIGAELSKSTKAFKALDREYEEENFSPLDTMISAFPNNGVLQPFEKRPIFFRFSPQFTNPNNAFKTTLQPPPRRDYAVFLHFKSVGSQRKTEIAITGTALPILLIAEPNSLNFDACHVGEKQSLTTVLRNDSDLKDVKFKFKKVANFTVNPASGRISPRSSRQITVSFIPHQIGLLNYLLDCDVIDKIVDKDSPLVLYEKSIWSIPIKLTAESVALTSIPPPKYSGGMMPLISNEAGINVNTTVADLKQFTPKIAVQNAPNTKIHKNRTAEPIEPGQENQYKIAYPNDRGKSIAPFNRDEKYKTLFTEVDRYNYIDPDYAYTNGERQEIEKHKLVYWEYIKNMRYRREEKLKTNEYLKTNNEKDIGLLPGNKLRPPNLTLKELEEEAAKNVGFYVDQNWRLFNTEKLKKENERISQMPVTEGLMAQPNSLKEREACNQKLSPSDLFKILVTPHVIDFGNVVVNSVAIKDLDFFNTLDQTIKIDVEIDCPELRQSILLSQVIPAKTRATFPIIFESNVLQSFQRSISYRINNFYHHHVIVLAETKLPTLELSTNHIVLNQLNGVTPDNCYRANLTLRNPYDAATEFNWMPIYGEQGTTFSIRPASGIIEPFKDLECEIVWHASYLAPLRGTFSLLVKGGESVKLTCEAKLGSTQVQFVTKRANFGKIPLNLSTVRSFYLVNSGTTHSYFQVLDAEPIPGMVISPRFGVVPVGGFAALKVEMQPLELIKFDARVLVQIRGGKTLELRLIGESEDPRIDISVPQFDFGGVYSGAKYAIPFELTNKSNVKAVVEFDLRRYTDFHFELQDKPTNEEEKRLKNEHSIYTIIVNSHEVMKLKFVFNPTGVATYQFELPICVNKPNAALNGRKRETTSRETSAVGPDNVSIISRSSKRGGGGGSGGVNGPQVHVIGIGLRYALHVTNTDIHFNVPLANLRTMQYGGYCEHETISMTNYSHRKIKWCIDMRNANRVLENGIVKFCHSSMVPFVTTDKNAFGPEGELQPNETFHLVVIFAPDKPGNYECSVPVIVNDNVDHPYYNINVTGYVSSPVLRFEPNILVLKPTPLGVATTEKIIITPENYDRESILSIDIPQVTTLDGEYAKVLTAEFANGSVIFPKNKAEPKEVLITFLSKKPISTTISLVIKDNHNNHFLADHYSEYQIVLEEGKVMKGSRLAASHRSTQSGEPILRRSSSGTTQATRTADTTTPTFDLDSDESIGMGTNDINQLLSELTSKKTTDHSYSPISRTQDSIMFPTSETESGLIAAETLKALQRWFTANGWPSSFNPVKVPDSFRCGITRKPLDDESDKPPQSDATKTDTKTIYDMIQYLCGKALPGIPVASPVPRSIIDRMKQFYWQHHVLLTFIMTQGGCVSYIRPEYLLDIKEFKYFNTDFEQLNEPKNTNTSGYLEPKHDVHESVNVSLDDFESVSKKAWLDCLLQLLKALYMSRITPKTFSNIKLPDGLKEHPLPVIKSDPLISNIYSINERVLLTWINHCYSNFKDKIWTNDRNEHTASARWIVNFDVDITDGLALASTIAAYCPFLIETHFKRMYTQADTAEKCFHNALILANSCRHIGIEYDINALDITDPNPILICLFCAYLYQTLPSYIPQQTIDFTCPLNNSIAKQIKITNPSSKNVLYQVLIVGPNADCFTLPNGNHLRLTSKSKLNLDVTYHGKTLKPGNAFLLLTAKKNGTMIADPICFHLKTSIDELTTKKNIKVQSSLYKLNEFCIDVENPFDITGDFRVKLIESATKDGSIRNPYTSDNKDENGQSIINNHPIFSAFYTKVSRIRLESGNKAPLPVYYLPLQTANKHTALIIFSNDTLGEFIYYIEGVPQRPETFKVNVDEDYLDTEKCRLIKTQKINEDVLAFRCFIGDSISIKLDMPILNVQREKAFITAAKMRMTPEELRKRQIHGILSSKSLIEFMESLIINDATLATTVNIATTPSYKKTKLEIDSIFSVESTNPNIFHVPDSLTVNQNDAKSDENSVPLLVQFCSDKAGVQSTTVILRSNCDDVRYIPIEIKTIEKTAGESSTAYLEFSTAVFDMILQPIPIINSSENACNYEVELIIGDTERGIFKGPKKFTVKPKDIFSYQLQFEPKAEKIYEATLKINNLTEGTHMKYMLAGRGERPPALADFKIETKVGEVTSYDVVIPNKSNKKVCFYIQSSLPFVRGPEKIMLLPNRKETYTFEVIPPQRGSFRGIVNLKPGEWPIKDIDSDGEEIIHLDSDNTPQNFTFWLSLDIQVDPTDPQAVVDIETSCFEETVLSVPLSNPFDNDISLSVFKEGLYISGSETIELKAKSKGKYDLKFSPKQKGRFKGSLGFYSEDTGEFWYDLRMLSTNPKPIQMPHVQCEVGRYTRHVIKLSNPFSFETSFKAFISNITNYNFELKSFDNVITVEPNGTVDVGIIFTPSTIGKINHDCEVLFINDKIGSLQYKLNGIGLIPSAQEVISISAEVGSSELFTVNFKNPTNTGIYCDLSLSDITPSSGTDENGENQVTFNILLNSIKNIYVAAKELLDVPIVFCPEDLRQYKCNLTISSRRENNLDWSDEQDEIKSIEWNYPIKGVAAIYPISTNNPILIECMVRNRFEKRMEISLSDFMTQNAQQPVDTRLTEVRSVTPGDATPKIPDGAIVGESRHLGREFLHSIVFKNGANHHNYDLLKNSIAIRLVRYHRDRNTGLVTLVFDIIFSPAKSFVSEAYLQIETTLGGTWRYPLKLVAIEPPPDDTITIEACGLNQESVVGFRLSSKTDQPAPFTAYISQNGSRIFSVFPNSGELLPDSANGTLLKIAFKPMTYGKIYTTQLTVKTNEYEWKYIVKGVPPTYTKPTVSKPAIQSQSPIKPLSANVEKRRNYVLDNTYITTTAVSSPIKGKPLVPMKFYSSP